MESYRRGITMTTTIYLDDGWSITEYDNIRWRDEGYSLRHTHVTGITYIEPNDPPICMYCRQTIPEYVMGFYNLCRWKK